MALCSHSLFLLLSPPHYSRHLFLFLHGVMVLENAWRSACAQREYAASIPPITACCCWDPHSSAAHPHQKQHRAGLLSEGSRAQALARQPSWGFTQRVYCPDCGLFMGSYIKSARFSAKSNLSLGKLHLCHLFQSWFTHIKQNTCKSFPFSSSPKRLAWHI